MISGRPELERFARALITSVRDRAIDGCDRSARGTNGPDGAIWRTAMESGSVEWALFDLIPEIVDEVLFELLDSIDTGELPLGWRTESGTYFALEELGRSETGGWLMGSPGWRHEYSRTRFSDPFADLELPIELRPQGGVQDSSQDDD